MSGGVIGGTTAAEKNIADGGGGGVYIFSGDFNMSLTAKISGNEAGGDGGGVYFYSTGTFDMSGGTIGGTTADEKNTAVNGGGVYVERGPFTMSGTANISGNTATGGGDGGGGVYVFDVDFIMSGGTISDNSASSFGGGVYFRSNTPPKTFTMSGGTIGGAGHGNNASNGGGVFVGNAGIFSMIHSDALINGNSANGHGGGVYLAGSETFTMSRGTISENEATGDGGGVFCGGIGTFEMPALNDAIISGNSASGSGGGVYVSNGTFLKTSGGIIHGYYQEDSNTNEEVYGTRNTAGDDTKGHAVYVGPTRKRNSTAGFLVDIDSGSLSNMYPWE
jgi:hypothetical protein